MQLILCLNISPQKHFNQCIRSLKACLNQNVGTTPVNECPYLGLKLQNLPMKTSWKYWQHDSETVQVKTKSNRNELVEPTFDSKPIALSGHGMKSHYSHYSLIWMNEITCLVQEKILDREKSKSTIVLKIHVQLHDKFKMCPSPQQYTAHHNWKKTF